MIDDRRTGYLRFLFAQFCADQEDVDARTMLAYSLFIGGYFVRAQHGERARAEVLELAIDRLLDGSWD